MTFSSQCSKPFYAIINRISRVVYFLPNHMDRSMNHIVWLEKLGSSPKWTVQKSLKWTVCESGRSQNPKLDHSEGSNWTILRNENGRSWNPNVGGLKK